MPILNFTITRDPAPSPATPWRVDAATGVHWYNDTSVVAGTAYVYQVIASNQVGESDASTIGATAATHPTSTNDDMVLYVAIGAAILIVAGVAVMAMRKKT